MATLKALLRPIRHFSPGLPHYLYAGVFLFRLIGLERLSRSALLLPVRGDMHFYSEWAHRIARGDFNNHGAFYGLPGYPYFLAAIYRLFGYSPFIPGLLQAAADAGTAVLIYLLTSRLLQSTVLGGRNSPTEPNGKPPEGTVRIAAALAATGWALFVPAQVYSIILMPTAGFVFVFWLVVWRIIANDRSPGWVECLGLGLLVGVTAMAIATVLFLIPLVIAAVLFKRGRVVRVRCLSAIVFVFAVGAGTSPCWIHNYFIARDPALLSAHGGVNFWIGNNPVANGYPRFPPGLRAGQAAMLEDSVTSAEEAVGRPLKRSEVSAYWNAKAQHYITTHPAEWMRLMLIKARNFWNAFQYDDLSIITTLREQGVALPGLYFGFVAALALPGLVIASFLSSTGRWIVTAIALHMIALMTVFITERYRLPIVPGLFVFAVFGIWLFRNAISRVDYRRILIYAALLVCSAAFVSWPQRDPALWALDAYNSGWQALESGDLPLAQRKLTIARAYVPTNPETNFAFGNLRLAQGNEPAAASFYLDTLRYDSDHRGALNNLAVIALGQRRYDLAETWLRHAEEIEPGNPKTHFLLARTLFAKGDRDAAAMEIDMALRLHPDQDEFNRLKQQIAGNKGG
jgi:4-amino-4-deoxy-L-arabinose transferase-like glycosyltransferase